MNQERIAVQGLKGNYKMLIDGQEIGTFSAADLAKGVNLAAIDRTPQYQQALAVMRLNERRCDIEQKTRDFAWVRYGFFQPLGCTDLNSQRTVDIMNDKIEGNLWMKGRRDLYAEMRYPEVEQAINDEMKLLVDRIYSINRPQLRHFALVPVR